jgi:hypothetical protein
MVVELFLSAIESSKRLAIFNFGNLELVGLFSLLALPLPVTVKVFCEMMLGDIISPKSKLMLVFCDLKGELAFF